MKGVLQMLYDLASLQVSLPEDILKKKWAGDFEGAAQAIDARLEKNLPGLLKSRLALEKVLLSRLPVKYVYSKPEALHIVQHAIPGFTEAEFDSLEQEGLLDFLYVRGEKRYFLRFFKTLLKVHPYLAKRAGKPLTPDSPLLDDAIREMKDKKFLGYRFHIKASLQVEPDCFLPGETYRVHIPLPILSEQTGDIDLIASSPKPACIASKTHPQRTVYFENKLEENIPFTVEYKYDSVMRYADLSGPAPTSPLYPRSRPPMEIDLAPVPPHITFTPYLQSLTREILQGETDPVKKARKIYDFITTRVNYSFMRQYVCIENLVEYAAVNLKGDCGIQALLFITLCRIAGIPARWQSGLTTAPHDIGCHDWAQFYIPSWGWLFCDCSFGGSAWRKGNIERWNFYFGNLDPFRMAANSAYQADFTPPKAFLRSDPYDNQTGECECGQKGFWGEEFDTAYELVSYHALK